MDNNGVQDEAEVLGKTDFDFFPKHIAEQFARDDATVLKQGRPLWTERFRLLKAMEKKAGCAPPSFPVGDRGEILGLVGFGQDISLEKRLKGELEAAAKIKEQQQMVEGMIADLAAIPEKLQTVNGITYGQADQDGIHQRHD